MKIFINSANLEHIKEAHDLGILNGVTISPPILAGEGITGSKNLIKHYQAICKNINGEVHAEVVSSNYNEMISEGLTLSKLNEKMVVKVPANTAGLKALNYFAEAGVRTNCTLIFSAGQALMVAKLGANYVSPFIEPAVSSSTDGVGLMEDINLIYDNYGFRTQIFANAITTPTHVINCAKIGADIVSCPLNVIKALFIHPLADENTTQLPGR